MHELLRHVTIKQRRQIAKLKEATMEFLDPAPVSLPDYRNDGSGFIGLGSTAGWSTVQQYANEICDMLLRDQGKIN